MRASLRWPSRLSTCDQEEVNLMKTIVIQLDDDKHLSTVLVNGEKVFDAQKDSGWVELKVDSRISTLGSDITITRRMI